MGLGWGWSLLSGQKQGGEEEKSLWGKKKKSFRRPFFNMSQFVPISLPSSPWIYLFTVLFGIGYRPG